MGVIFHVQYPSELPSIHIKTPRGLSEAHIERKGKLWCMFSIFLCKKCSWIKGQVIQIAQNNNFKSKKEKREKNITKVEKPKAVGHFLVQKMLISAHAWAKMS